MKHAENTSLYFADEGKVFVRKADSFVMGNGLDLSTNDSITNYIERDATNEEKEQFYPKHERPRNKSRRRD